MNESINNRVCVKRHDGLIIGCGQSWKTKEQAIRTILDGRHKLWWIILYLQGWRVVNG